MVLWEKQWLVNYVCSYIRLEYGDHLRWLVMATSLEDVVGSRRSWTPPLVDFVSLSVDGSFKHDLHLMGMGVVVRDSNGV